LFNITDSAYISSIKNIFSASAFSIVIIIESIASLFASGTADISTSTFCHSPAEVIFGVTSVVVPPES